MKKFIKEWGIVFLIAVMVADQVDYSRDYVKKVDTSAMVGDNEVTPGLGDGKLFQVQTIRVIDEENVHKTNLWTRDWAKRNPDVGGKGPWFRRDPKDELAGSGPLQAFASEAFVFDLAEGAVSFEAGEDGKVERAIKDAGGSYDNTKFGDR